MNTKTRRNTMSKRMRITVLSLLLLSYSGYAQDSTTVAVFSDVHYLSPSLAGKGKALADYESATGRNTNDMHAILDEVLANIQQFAPDILLIPGDLTKDGARQSHLDFKAKLLPLAKRGTRIFVIPGNHDVNVPTAKKYDGDKTEPIANVSPGEFAEIYADFGYGNALRRDSASLSYLAAINDSLWLLCFDTNRYAEYKTSTISSGRILPQTLSWTLEILREAKKSNIKVMGMMHHGLVEHMPYQSTFFASYLINDWQKNAAILADAGLKVVFTGHFHANDASAFTSSAGNTITDVETGSLAQFPFPYREMVLKKGNLHISTAFVQSIPGKPFFADEYRQKLEKQINAVAGNRLSSLGLPLPEDARSALVQMIVKMNLLHVQGDEVLDDDLRQRIENFGALMDDPDIDLKNFQLDFPPADNTLDLCL